ncbi:uncharacterized protein [Oncorhynchus clarkii lewisi]|uniref:uncharacterized protein n=1 Tax=Oncorhynchus clarkii lewisi TaxID=490388 RepID=UPI0039B985DF
MTTHEVRVVGLPSFRNLWRKLLPHISSTKPSTDLCWQCQRNNYQVFRSANLPEAVKSAKLKKQEQQEQHLLLVQSERSVYQKTVADCKTTCQDLQLPLGALLNQQAKTSGCITALILLNKCSSLQPGPIYFFTPRKCGLFGVCCEGIPQQVNYLIDEGMLSSKVKDSTLTGVNIPQLVGLEDGTVLVESYGWQQHLTLYFRPLLQIKQYRHFT